MTPKKEFHAKNFLQPVDLSTYSRLSKAEIVCGKRNAHSATNSHKAPHKIKGRKS